MNEEKLFSETFGMKSFRNLLCQIKNDLKLCFIPLFFSYNDECDGYYYFNTKTKARQWEHPLDAEYKRLVEKARRFSATGVNDLSDVMQLFTFIFYFHQFTFTLNF